MLAEQSLGSDKLTGFVRAGISDGRTGPFKGAWQAGFLLEKFLPARPEGRLSLGLHQGFLAGGYRANAADAGDPQRPGELGWELTYEDKLAPWLAVQPDVQYVRATSREPGAEDALVVGLRITLSAPAGS